MEANPRPPPLTVLLFAEETKELGEWVEALVLERLSATHTMVAKRVVPEAQFFSCAQELCCPELAAGRNVLIVLVFFDGQSEEGKEIFLEFRGWAGKTSAMAVQALNAKKGTHTLTSNPEAVFVSLKKKLESWGSVSSPTAAKIPSAAVTTSTDKKSAAVATESPPPAAAAATAAAAAANGPGDALQMEERLEELSLKAIQRRLEIGQGEAFWLVQSPPDAFPKAVADLKALVAANEMGCFPATAEPKELPGPKIAQEFIIRRALETEHIELRLAMCGNVDSGKSTLTSVLTRGRHDDGRGLARSYVFNHKHEADTGRTSSVSENHLGFAADGKVVNYPEGGLINPKSQVNNLDMSRRSSKIVTLYDLAGHEKYLKTTVLGMTRTLPDYACIVISANNGIQRMTKEHLGLCLALKLPFFIVVTRIDATPENIHQETTAMILKLLKMPTVKKLPYPIRKEDDVVVCAKNLKSDRICPIFEVSNVSGQGIKEVLSFINLLPIRKDWHAMIAKPKEMVIDSTFFVAGVGTVVGGVITQGVFKPNDTVLLGPDSLGNFRPAQIRSIHVKGVEVHSVEAGNDAALCLKKERRNAIRKGNVLVDPSLKPRSYWQFEAEIVILYHSTTISNNYEPVIHSATVRQSARVMLIDRDVLRTGDRAMVRFHFLYRPEYMSLGQRIIFREGRTKGIGTVVRTVEGFSEEFVLGHGAKQRVKELVKHADPQACPAAAEVAAALASANPTKAGAATLKKK